MQKNELKAVFLYTTAHPSHAMLAKEINARFIENRRKGILKTPFAGKLAQAFAIQKKIPECNILLCEGSSTDLFAGAIYKKAHPSTKLIGIVSDPKIPIMNTLPFFDKLTLNWSMEMADLLLPSSEMMKNFIPNEFRQKAAVFHPAANVNYYSKFKANLNKKNLAFVGLLSKHKAIDVLVNYFNEIKGEFPKTNLYIIGNGPLFKLKDKHFERVHFEGFKKSPVTFYSKKASVYVNLARLEPAGIAVIEAMCMGLIPIVSEGVGYKSAVKKISKKLVVHSPREFKEALEYIWKNKKHTKALSKKAKSVGRKYGASITRRQFKQTIKNKLP